MLKTMISSRVFLNRNISVLHCSLCRPTLMTVPGISCAFQIGQSSKRSVHYEPHVDPECDRKQKEVLEKFEITKEDCNIYPGIWKIHPQTIEHHGLLLTEGGFSKISASLIVSYFKVVRKKISLLKLHNYIRPETKVTNFLLHHLGSPPLGKIAFKNNNEDQNSFMDVCSKVVKSFLVWRLESSEEEIEEIMKKYPRIKHKSLKYMSWALDILEHDLNFSKEKILRHGYLIHSYPPNTLDTLNRVPTLCGEDIKVVFSRHPKIIMMATKSLLNTIQHFKDFNIPDSSVRRCFEIFTLGSESVKNRLQQMHTEPKLRHFVGNPRAIFIVHYQRKINARLDHLHDLKRQNASLHVLTSHESYFEKFARQGTDRSRGHDIVHFLIKRLGSEESSLRNYLGRHPFWCSVSCTVLQNTLDFLMDNGFSEKDVLDNLHITLYPRDQIENILTELPTLESVKNAQELVRKRKHSPNKEVTLTKSHQLALCLYFLEKDHHFTGNGVWNTS